MSQNTQEPVSRDEIERLKARVRKLEHQLEQTPQATHNGLDSRDAAVLAELGNGQRVTAGTLKELYQVHTDVTQEGTLKKRLKNLTKKDCFNSCGPGRWVYRGN